jgi:type IV pilus assembly protein PilZ
MQPIGGGARNGILSLTIKDKAVLYAAYMPFVKNGGMFIPTNKSYKLGDEVFMLLSLMDGGKSGLGNPEGSPGQSRGGDRCTV